MFICLLAACVVYPYYINKTLAMEPEFIFDAYSYTFLETPEIGFGSYTTAAVNNNRMILVE